MMFEAHAFFRVATALFLQTIFRLRLLVSTAGGICKMSTVEITQNRISTSSSIAFTNEAYRVMCKASNV